MHRLRKAAALRGRAVALLVCCALLQVAGCRAQNKAAVELKSPAPPAYNRERGPIATHRFWTQKNWVPLNKTADGGPYWTLPEPLAVQATAAGLLVGSSHTITVEKTFFTHPIQPDFTLATTAPHASAAYVVASTDRMVDLDFGSFQARLGRGMPFVYLNRVSADVVVTFVAPPHIFAEGGGTLGVRLGENTYGLFCPGGNSGSSRWTHDGLVYTCHKGTADYFSAAVLPSAGDLALFARYAYTFPISTDLRWSYSEAESTVETTFSVTTRQKEGPAPAGGFLQALYPHQYTSLHDPVAANADVTRTWTSARGAMRLLVADSFTTRDTFHGVLPFLPLPHGTELKDEQAEVQRLAIEFARSGNLIASSDTYNTGKQLHRAAQVLPLLQGAADPAPARKVADALKAEFARWQGAPTAGKPGFRYDARWSTLIGYPAAFGSDTQLNDHHFHYGYWLQSAALLGLQDRAWLNAAPTRKLLDELAGDIANVDPASKRYPLLRHFDPYAGHSWASGQAPFGDGQNEESSSEAVNAWAALILYAAETGDRRLRDAAVWMYTLETNAAADYWFNSGPVSTFPQGFSRVQVANVFDGKADAATWFGDAPEFEHGIEFLPFTGASLYLGRDPAYVGRNLAEVQQLTGGKLRTDSNYWPDLMELYEAFSDPELALEQWRKTAFTFDGETRAHELAWLSSLHAYGLVSESVQANTPFYAVFRKGSVRIHIAFNLGAQPIEVVFTDGVRLKLAPNSYGIGDVYTGTNSVTQIRPLR